MATASGRPWRDATLLRGFAGTSIATKAGMSMDYLLAKVPGTLLATLKKKPKPLLNAIFLPNNKPKMSDEELRAIGYDKAADFFSEDFEAYKDEFYANPPGPIGRALGSRAPKLKYDLCYGDAFLLSPEAVAELAPALREALGERAPLAAFFTDAARAGMVIVGGVN